MNIIQRPAHPTNYTHGRRLPISRITFHHIVGDAPGGTDGSLQAGHGVSPTFAIASNGTIYQYVAEGNTPWTDGNGDSNSRSITIEHAGGKAGVPYTEAMYRSSIELCRYLIGKYGIKDFQRHRDVIDKRAYPGGTACPGQLDVERIVREANNKENDVADLVTPNDVVNNYQELVDRTPTQAEINQRVSSKQTLRQMLDDIYSSGEYKTLRRVNPGDLANLKGAGITNVDAAINKHWKKAFYENIAQNLPTKGVNHDTALKYIQDNLK